VLAPALTVAAVLWAAVAVAAPLAASSGRFHWLSFAAYQIGALICHQRPERSFHLAAVQMPVCARCLGLYAGGALGLVLAWAVRRAWPPVAARLILAVTALPIAVSVALEWIGAIETTNLFRAATGLPLGLAAGFLIIGALRLKSGEGALATEPRERSGASGPPRASV
jgi:uncharacterized membrane protein